MGLSVEKLAQPESVTGYTWPKLSYNINMSSSIYPHLEPIGTIPDIVWEQCAMFKGGLQ